MTKLSLLGVVAVTAYAALTASAFAQNRPYHAGYVPNNGYEGVCPGYEAGNPFNKYTEFSEWSAWRVRGGWDDRNDLKCMSSHAGRGEF